MADITSDLKCCTDQISLIKESVHDAGKTLDILVETTSRTAAECMTSGVGSQLVSQSAEWKSLATGAASDEPNDSYCNSFVRMSKDANYRLKLTETQTGEVLAQFADSIAAVNARIPAIDEASSMLATELPIQLANHLVESVREYTPTGMTPKSRDVSYPTDLTCTGRHSVLLSEFRRDNCLSPLNTPTRSATPTMTQPRVSQCHPMLTTPPASSVLSERNEKP